MKGVPVEERALIEPWRRQERSLSSYGTDTGYPASPVQTPAGSFPAPGSLVVLASALQGSSFKQTPAAS